MAKQSLTTSKVSIGGVAYGASGATVIVSSCVVNETIEELDTTDYGSAGVRKREGGLKDGSVTIGFKLDDSLATAQTINALLGTDVAITYQTENAALSAANPELQFNVLVTQGIGIGGDVGSLAEATVTWPMTTAVTYDTTP